MQNGVTKEEWVAMFKEIGLDDKTMGRWHKTFEERHPEGHKSFLSWLGIPADEVNKIRSSFN